MTPIIVAVDWPIWEAAGEFASATDGGGGGGGCGNGDCIWLPWDISCIPTDGASDMLLTGCCCAEVKNPEWFPSEWFISEKDAGFSNLGLLSGEPKGKLEENPTELKLLPSEAASSATRDERTEVSIWAEDVEAASFAATAAAVAFLLSSSVSFEVVKVAGCISGSIALPVMLASPTFVVSVRGLAAICCEGRTADDVSLCFIYTAWSIWPRATCVSNNSHHKC